MIKRKTHIGRNILCLFADQNSMLDIIADSTSIKKQGGKWDVTMTDKEWKFLNNQRQNPPIGRCESFVERWEIAQKRRQKRENRVHNQSFEESFQVADEADIQSSLGEEDNSEVINLLVTKYLKTMKRHLRRRCMFIHIIYHTMMLTIYHTSIDIFGQVPGVLSLSITLSNLSFNLSLNSIFEVNHISVFCILDTGYAVVLCNFILKNVIQFIEGKWEIA